MRIEEIIAAIKNSKKIAITCHTSPDGDSLGSLLGLFQGLLSLNKEVYVLSKEELPKTFEYLPCSNEIKNGLDTIKEETDLVIVLDCGNVDRINAKLHIDTRSYTLINIDHHLSNELYGDINYVETQAAAVGEIIYKILCLLNVSITKEIAVCLYTSLLTDTGSFRHSNTTFNTHNVAGKLIETGIDFSQVHRNIFGNISYNRLKLQGKVIENMYLSCNDKICIMKITKDMLDEYNIDKGDTSDVVSIGTKIDTVEVTILLKEADEGVKASLRSKNIVDVRDIAEKFNGGGHIRAAGFLSYDTMDKIEEKLINYIEKELI